MWTLIWGVAAALTVARGAGCVIARTPQRWTIAAAPRRRPAISKPWQLPSNSGARHEHPAQDFTDVPVILLCGGRSGVLHAKTPNPCNKALLQLQDKPFFGLGIRRYSLYGARNFILATGIQGDAFAPALRALGAQASGSDPQVFHLTVHNHPCQIRLVRTGVHANSAQRLLACKPRMEGASRFALTYSDTVSNVDLGAEMRFHKAQKLVATLVFTRPPVRFRILGIRQGEALVRAFAPRLVIENTCINGGYYIFSAALWDSDYGVAHNVALESQPLERLLNIGAPGTIAMVSATWPCCSTSPHCWTPQPHDRRPKHNNHGN